MTVVAINAIEVPHERGPELEARFAARLGLVDAMPGFAGVELLRPNDGGGRYFVVTRWADDASFRAWVGSDAFRAAHRRTSQRPLEGTGQWGRSEVLVFDVVTPTPVVTGSS